jgi:outer membrane protein assembly factor BamB
VDVLIDLDRPDPRPDPGERLPRWSGPTPGQLRVLFVVVALLVAAFGVGASTAPRPVRFGGPVRIPGTGADEFLLGADLIAVNSSRDQRVYAYALDGRLLWATALPFPRATLAALTGDLVLFTSPMWPGRTAALDQRTGAPRWAVDGLVVSELEDTVVVGRGSPTSDRFDEEIVAVDAATGRERWRSATGVTRADSGLVVFGPQHRVTGHIRLGADGGGELLDFRTGQRRPLRGVPVPLLGPSPVTMTVPDGAVAILRYQGALSVGDLTVIFPYPPDPGGPAPTGTGDGRAAAYGPDSPDPLWTADAKGGTSVLPCGPWLCFTDADTTRVLDPSTGAERRRVGWPHVISGSAERFLGYDYAGMVTTTQIAVFDARSGRRLASYDGWVLVSVRYGEWVPMLRRGSGLSWHLATLSLDTGIAYPLGTIDAAGERACQSTATHVGCTIRSGEVMLWRHNRGLS